jgi:aminoglycoside phosphotransferase (APT) family kinase protein
MSDLAEQLQAVVSDALSEPGVTIGALHQLTGGASRETWSFVAATPGGDGRPLILRRDPPTAIRPEGIAKEAQSFQAAARAGVPEPGVLAWGDDPRHVDAPFIVMEHIEGETLARRILRDAEYDAVRPHLAQQCGRILAHIHSIPLEDVPALEAYDVVEYLGGQLARFDDQSPALVLGLRWLDQNRPPENPPAVVHGDFRNGNLIIGPDGVRAVLDWELVHRGDPMEDLGYLCTRAWRFGSDKPVGGFGDYAELFSGYEEVSGRRVDPDIVRWWEVVGTVRWGIGCMEQAWRHLSGDVRSVELAAIGRRVWEQEYDVMLLLSEQLARV